LIEVGAERLQFGDALVDFGAACGDEVGDVRAWRLAVVA
jgi:hypothetical protein